MLERLRGIVASGLRAGNSVVLVTTKEHRLDLVSRLSDTGVKLATAAREGRLTLLDADDTLAGFMRDGRPDQLLFRQSVGAVLHSSRNGKGSRALTVFGEMVAVLWQRGEKDAALELEELWNDAISERAFHLHCAYPRRYFSGDVDGDARLQQICSAHTHCYPLVSQSTADKVLAKPA